MSSTYVFCRAKFADEKSAANFAEHINKCFLGKASESEKSAGLITMAPRYFLPQDGKAAPCWFDAASVTGNNVDLQMDVFTDFLEERNNRRLFAQWLSGAGARQALMVGVYSGNDEIFDFYELNINDFQNAYMTGQDPAIDEQLEAAEGELSRLVSLVLDTPIHFKEDYRSEEERLRDDLSSAIRTLSPYQLSDGKLDSERPPGQWSLQFDAKRLADAFHDQDLNETQKTAIDNLLRSYHDVAVREVFKLLNDGGYQISRDGVMLSNYFPPYPSEED